MTTVGQLLDTTVRQHLEMGGPADINRLQSAIIFSDEALVLDWMPEASVRPGAYIEINTEVMLVVESAGTALTVLRAQWGTTAGGHDAGDIVRIQPRFLRSQVLTELQDEIRSWPRNLFSVVTTNVTWATGVHDTDLTGATGRDVVRILEARLEPISEGDPWFDVAGDVSVHPAEVSQFTSGWRLHTLRWFGPSTVEVTYGAAPNTTTLTEITDLETIVGLSANMLDIARFGVASRLMLSQESERARLDSQNQTRLAEEVPPQHLITQSDALLKKRDQRIMDEVDRLISRYGFT